MTDMLDRLVCESTYGGFLFQCPDQNLCKEIIEELAPLQMGEKEPEVVLYATLEETDAYYAHENEQMTMAEIDMM